MDSMIDLLKVIGRIYTILPLLLAVTLIMGKRSIGELPVFDFLVILTLGSVVGADIAEPKVNHLFTMFAVIAIASLQMLVSYIKGKNRKFGRLVTFEPTIFIYKRKFLVKNMQTIKYSIDNVLQMLREKNVFNVTDVEMAIIEANGELSVKLIPQKETARAEHFTSPKRESSWELPIIIDGIVYKNVMRRRDISEEWLKQELSKKKVKNTEDVFYAAVNGKRELHISLKDDKYKPEEPLLYH
ncbi:DUF421 domain-containing protein [Cytobacillus sp. NCCP-133]|uniref:DUF421 domain-containing protein n=1 Tax=Cytobacillus sp. NCCP-133 TaxID=766848 RepID=UPI00222E2EE7|nr:DUF421 domain-containing protein [Cytobacillus sp. NCCP-133]GLB58701.1 DUF421 domain-containing protein [Cytobacillus sp. NCCP-133]